MCLMVLKLDDGSHLQWWEFLVLARTYQIQLIMGPNSSRNLSFSLDMFRIFGAILCSWGVTYLLTCLGFLPSKDT